ncbi:hypothetical protein [Pantoea brenneri]|uniref:hypothetical protein n=1 Tax=Pantoea brenneri TaxID=472694 RepID=UPI0028964F2F|nr:hypothetical protein [Pantoea brenneri]
MKKFIICGFCLITMVMMTSIAGCSARENVALKSQPTPEREKVSPESVTNEVRSSLSPLAQCNRDLESLRTVNMTEYRKYLAQYDGLMKSSAGFMSVKDDVSPEVAELARPRFQYALVNLCYRIKGALAQTLINQAIDVR